MRCCFGNLLARFPSAWPRLVKASAALSNSAPSQLIRDFPRHFAGPKRWGRLLPFRKPSFHNCIVRLGRVGVLKHVPPAVLVAGGMFSLPRWGLGYIMFGFGPMLLLYSLGYEYFDKTTHDGASSQPY